MGYLVIGVWLANPVAARHVRSGPAKTTARNHAEPKMIHGQAHVSSDDSDVMVPYEHYSDAGTFVVATLAGESSTGRVCL